LLKKQGLTLTCTEGTLKHDDKSKGLVIDEYSLKGKEYYELFLKKNMPGFADTKSLFSAIEQIKNGALFSAKYESGDIITETPHILCFSNFLPVSPKALSRDRWTILRIGNTTKTLIAMNTTQINDFIRDYQDFEKDLAKKKLEQKQEEQKQSKKGEKKVFFNSVYEGLFDEEGDQNIYRPTREILQKYGD
jgi:hypothetical protein